MPRSASPEFSLPDQNSKADGRVRCAGKRVHGRDRQLQVTATGEAFADVKSKVRWLSCVDS